MQSVALRTSNNQGIHARSPWSSEVQIKCVSHNLVDGSVWMNRTTSPVFYEESPLSPSAAQDGFLGFLCNSVSSKPALR